MKSWQSLFVESCAKKTAPILHWSSTLKDYCWLTNAATRQAQIMERYLDSGVSARLGKIMGTLAPKTRPAERKEDKQVVAL